MSRRPGKSDPFRAERRRIVRRATWLTLGFFLAAVVVAVVGSAIVAWLLSTTGLPFLKTWIALSIIMIVVPLIWIAVEAIRRRRGGGDAP